MPPLAPNTTLMANQSRARGAMATAAVAATRRNIRSTCSSFSLNIGLSPVEDGRIRQPGTDYVLVNESISTVVWRTKRAA